MANNLMDYLPDYYNDVYEMQEIMHAQGGVLDKAESEQLRLLLNQFVTQTDAKGISVFEDQVGIKPAHGDDLATRQNKVLMRLLPPRPITIWYLRDLFATLKIPATITAIKRDAIVEAKSAEINSSQIENIKYLLNIYLPANMIYEIRVALNRAEISNDFNIGLGIWSKVTTAVQANVSQFIN
ncbi:YmfQ family protein [Lactobacillus kullabergensis]|uniref:putative phage tail protein n=1 Tax=Lactobacillus kullabergensis TaxID=1218493 RepID=UPI0022469A42|nr:putative phage tail protein [Lactobacillus kullabergensis]MCX0290969.1 YmfQ family protein [Lactobacillus kullabergensis]